MEIYYGLRISMHNILLNSLPEDIVNSVIYAIQNAGFKSLSDLQFVQEEHLMFILKPIHRRKLIKAWRKLGMIEELKCEYEKMKNQNVSWEIDKFLTQAKNSSGSSTSQVDMENITDLLKTNVHRILNSVSEQMINNIIYALKYAGLESLSDLQFVQEDDLPQVLDPIQRRKLLKAWNQQGILFPFSSTSAIFHEPFTVNRNFQEDSNAMLRWPPNNSSSRIPSSLPGPPPQVFHSADHGPLSPGPPPGVSHFTAHGPLLSRPPPGDSHFTAHGPLLPRPPTGNSHFTAHGPLLPRPPPEVSNFTTHGPLLPRLPFGVSNAASTSGETTAFAELSSNESLSSFTWKWNKSLALLRLYKIYKAEFSSSITNNQRVWMEIAKKVGRNSPHYDAEQCCNQIQELKFKYESMKHIIPYELSQSKAVLLDEAENAFENIENPVVLSVHSKLENWIVNRSDRIKLLQVYAKYKAQLLLPNFDVERQIIWGKIAREVSKECCTYYGKRWCCYEINRLKNQYEIFKKKDLKKCGTPYFFHEAKKCFEWTERTGQHEEINTLKDFSLKQERRDCFTTNNASSTISDLSTVTQRQASMETSHMDTSESLPNQFNTYVGQTNDLSPPGPPTGVYSLAAVGGESIVPSNLYKLLFKNSKWRRVQSLALLRAYARYRTELSCLSEKENHKVWKKIADEVHQASKCLRCFHGKHKKRCSFVSESLCMKQIEVLRLQYHENKNENVLSSEMVKFFKAARNAFENSASKKSTIAGSSNNVFLQSFKWIWKKRVALLRLYGIYKAELSSSNVNEQCVWKKIADKIGNCEANQCQSQLENLKSEYESIKHSKPYEVKELEAVFLDEAENVFENIENPVVFSLESNLEKWSMNRSDHKKLLQVYAKYKEELLLKNFDAEQQIVWGKVAREVSEKCASYYGKRRCCYEIHSLKRVYESFKIRKEKNGKKKRQKKIIHPPYFFNEARKAFECTEFTGNNRYEEVNSSENFTVKQETNANEGRRIPDNDRIEQVNSLENFTVKQETDASEGRRNWYTHMAF